MRWRRSACATSICRSRRSACGARSGTRRVPNHRAKDQPSHRRQTMATTTGSSHVYVGGAQSKPGTLGGVFRRAVGDDRWEQLGKGLPEAVNVHAITVHPDNPDIVYLGTKQGPFRSTDRGERWERPAFDAVSYTHLRAHETP